MRFFGLVLGLLGLAACASMPDRAVQPEARGPLAAPRGYIAFCTRQPQFCDGYGPAQVKLTAKRWAALLKVNDTVNRSLKPQSDSPPAGMADEWTLAAGAAQADCEDYVLAKKAQLLAEGWPGPALRIAVIATGEGARHAVLLADTDEGVFVLDNLERKVLRWSETGYRFVLVQVSTQPDRWEGLTKASFSR